MMSESKPVNAFFAWGSLAVLLLAVCVRVTSGYTPFPWWDSDPFLFAAPVVGLTPTWALALNFVMILASGGVVWGVKRAGGRVLVVPGVFLVVVQVVVMIHAMRDLNTLMPGLDLVAAGFVGYGCWHATQLPRGRAVIAGVLLGLVCVLGLIGLHEIFVQHPQTVAGYEADKERFLASQGWAPGSFQALAYERRLMQPDPTAWFGLSNVYASVVGAMGIGLLVLGVRARKSKLAILYFAGGLLGVVLVVLSRSTGAMGAMAIAAGIAGLCAWMPKLRFGAMVIIGSLGVVGAVIGRGMVGERIGELSILFRSQYMQGAVRMFGEHPVVGVGPGSFQSHYARLKPPTSPEDVANPHSIGFDLLSTLGLGGMALLAVFGMMVWSIAPKQGEKERDSFTAGVAEPGTRVLGRVIGLVVVFSTVLSIRLASGAIHTELIVVQAIGAAAWGLVAWMVATRGPEEAVRWALATAAAVLMVHGQLDLTPTFAVSAAVFAAMIGAAGTIAPKAHAVPKLARWQVGLAGLVVIGPTAVLADRGMIVVRWENGLDRAGLAAQAVAIQRDLNPGDPQLRSMERDAREVAVGELLLVFHRFPEHTGTRMALTGQVMWLGFDAQARGEMERAVQLWETAVDLATAGLDAPDAQAPELRWAGTVLMARADAFGEDPKRDFWRGQAVAYWTRAWELTPHDPNLAVMIMDGHLELGQEAQARQWARRALEINGRMHLDPVRQFDAQTVARVRLIAGQ